MSTYRMSLKTKVNTPYLFVNVRVTEASGHIYHLQIEGKHGVTHC